MELLQTIKTSVYYLTVQHRSFIREHGNNFKGIIRQNAYSPPLLRVQMPLSGLYDEYEAAACNFLHRHESSIILPDIKQIKIKNIISTYQEQEQLIICSQQYQEKRLVHDSGLDRPAVSNTTHPKNDLQHETNYIDSHVALCVSAALLKRLKSEIKTCLCRLKVLHETICIPAVSPFFCRCSYVKTKEECF